MQYESFIQERYGITNNMLENENSSARDHDDLLHQILIILNSYTRKTKNELLQFA
jgi:hypothetical protein